MRQCFEVPTTPHVLGVPLARANSNFPNLAPLARANRNSLNLAPLAHANRNSPNSAPPARENMNQNLAPPSCGATSQPRKVILDALRTAAHSTDPLESEEIEACIKQIKIILLVRKKASSVNKKLGLQNLLTRLYSHHQPDEPLLPFKQLQCTQIVAIGLSVPQFELNRRRYKSEFIDEVVNELVASAPHLQRKLGSQIFADDIYALIAGLQSKLRSPDYTAFLAS